MGQVISGKVAAIIDDTTLVLNVGFEHGVEEGMAFRVVAEYQEIKDPDTGIALGQWEKVKAEVVVSHVQEKMCTVRSPAVEEEEGTSGTLSSMMVQHSFGRYGQHQLKHQKLPVRSGDISGQPQSNPIVVGDLARWVPAVDSDIDQEDDSTMDPVEENQGAETTDPVEENQGGDDKGAE